MTSTVPATMRAAVLATPGGPDALVVQSIPIPVPAPGWVLIRVRAVGLNRSELHTRLGLAEGVTFPRVLGIEATGEVVDCPGGELEAGQRVVAMMGGMGRTFDGGYAEYTCVPVRQVIAVNSRPALEAARRGPRDAADRIRQPDHRARLPARPDPADPRRNVLRRDGGRRAGQAPGPDRPVDHPLAGQGRTAASDRRRPRPHRRRCRGRPGPRRPTPTAPISPSSSSAPRPFPTRCGRSPFTASSASPGC